MFNTVVAYLVLLFAFLILTSLAEIGKWVYEKVDDAWNEHMRKINDQNKG